EEIRNLTKSRNRIISLREAGFTEEIPEPFDTLEENARQKAKTVYQKLGKNCFSEDTGLEVKAWNGKPGVHSARYAGPQKDALDNIKLLLKYLENIEDRAARFRTVISFFFRGKEEQFEGICEGVITGAEKGEGGFGYDPIFIPNGADCTFAQMNMTEKSKYSHRGKAFKKFTDFLKEQEKTLKDGQG